MQTQPIPPVRLSCLNEYIARLQKELERKLSNDMALLNANRLPPEQKALVRQDVDREVEVMLWEIDTARKYKLTPSALSMIARLKPERGQGVMDPLPCTALWVMLDDPQGTSLFFSCYSHAWSAYRDQHPGILNRYQEERGTQEWYGWTLEVLEPGSVKHRYAYYPRRQQWTMGSDSSNWIVSSGRTPCPSKRCRLLNRNHQENFPNWSICNDCLPDFEYWTSWFPVAYMALNGDFAETEEPQQSTEVTERELRKVRSPGGAEVKEVAVQHTFQVVTFDISVKRRGQLPQDEREERAHPTWLEQAIADGTVLYVSKHIGHTQRTFYHERYVNMRGKTIDVRPHDKRIPMSVLRLKQTIYQAVAEQGQTKRSNESGQPG